MKVKVAVAGVGNTASVLVQGIRHYADHRSSEGLWHPIVGGLRASEVEVVAAFDIDSRKVGLDLSDAVFSEPNVATRRVPVPRSGVKVTPGLSKGVVPPHLSGQELHTEDRKAVSEAIRSSSAAILVNLISSGTEESSAEYARAALDAKCSFVNCTPSVLTKDSKLIEKFRLSKLGLVGDDLMSQFGGTIFHKGILNLMVKRGIRISKSYQLDVGGGAETFNTIDEEIRRTKRKLKTAAVLREVPYSFETVAGTTDFVDYLGNDRTSYFWVEGSGFMNSSIGVDVYLRSSDGANAGNILLDVIRALRASQKARRHGLVDEICDYGFKSPRRPTRFDEAYQRFTAKYVDTRPPDN